MKCLVLLLLISLALVNSLPVKNEEDTELEPAKNSFPVKNEEDTELEPAKDEEMIEKPVNDPGYGGGYRGGYRGGYGGGYRGGYGGGYRGGYGYYGK